MDPLSLTASAAGLIALLVQIAGYAQSVKDADQEREAFRKELLGLKPLLERLEQHGKEEEAGESWMQGKGELARILKELQELLEEMAHDLKPHKGRGFRKLYHKLVWTWEKGKFQGWVIQIERYILRIRFFVGEDHFYLSKDTNDVSKDTNQVSKETKTLVRGISENSQESTARIRKIESQGQETTNRLEDIKDSGEETNLILRKMQAEKKMQDDREEREGIAQWLSPYEFLSHQKQIFDNSYPLGQWLLKSEMFQRWFHDGPWQLRLLGDAGAGKSHLSAILVNHLQQNFDPSITPVICMYLESNKSRSERQMQADLIGGLLKQLIQQNESDVAPEDLRVKYRKYKAIDAKLSLEELEMFLLAEVQRYERVFLVVDGMDECAENTKIWLEELLKDSEARNVSTLVTIRSSDPPTGHIICHNPECRDGPLPFYWHCRSCPSELGMDFCKKCKEAGISCGDPSHELYEPYEDREVQVCTPPEELKVFVKGEMEKETGSERKHEKRDTRIHPTRRATSFGARLLKNPALADEVATRIVDRADGKFLFAKLYWDSLKKQRTTGDIEDALGKFPDSLDRLYEDAMEDQILHQDNEYNSALAKKILMILCCAQQYMNIDELLHALATTKGDKEYNRKKDYGRQEVQDVTKGYVSIGTGVAAPVRLFHATFDAYLYKTRDRWFPGAAAEMAAICLTYLNFDPLSRPYRNIREFQAKELEYPLVSYASQSWGFHVRKAGENPELRALVLAYLQDGGRVTACMQAAWCAQTHIDSHWSFPKRVDGLHLCAWFGLAEEISELAKVNEEMDVDVRETSSQQTPLMWACSRKNIEVVQQLLKLGADVNSVDIKGRTALLEAIENNHEPAVRALVETPGLEINTVYPAQLDGTALMLAAKLGYVDIVRVLLRHPAINVNHQDNDGATALARATNAGHEDIVEELLARPEIQTNLVNTRAGYSALAWAAVNNLAGLVEKLLARGADATLRDRPDGYTAAMIAADYGSFDAMKAMLDRGADAFALDNHGRTLLHGACGGGGDRPDIVGLLIERGLGVNVQDKNGFTALHEAGKTGAVSAAQILLDGGGDPRIKDNFGRNPFMVALQYGQQGFLESMLEHRGPEFDYQSEFFPDLELKNLPVYALVNLRRDNLLEAVLAERPSSLSDQEPITRETALHRAIYLDDISALSKLLPYISANIRDRNERTPLHVAAEQGKDAATTLLLQNSADPEALDVWGWSALMLAQTYRCLDVALALVKGGASLAAPRLDLQELLFYAVEKNSVAAATRLVAQGASVVEKNETGRTALEVAKHLGNGEMIQAVKSSQTFFRDPDEETPLSSPDTPKAMVGGRSPFRMPDNVRT